MNATRGVAVVTGAAGFIGGAAALRLAGSGYDVIGLDLPGRRFEALARRGVSLREGDIADPESIPRALSGARPRLVVHCAAFMGGWSDPSAYRRINVEGTRHVAEWAAREGASRFVYISSVTVYGLPPRDGVNESTPQASVGMPYADSKIEAERVLGEIAARGLPVTILRPGDVYGPRSHEWVTKLVDSMRAGKLPLIGGGLGRVNLTQVDNLVDAIEAAASQTAPLADYIITDGAPVTWKRYLETLADAAGCAPPRWSIPSAVAWTMAWALEGVGRVTGRRPPLSRLGMRLLTSRTGYDIGKARRELGWSPRVDFAEGMRLVAGWLREQRQPAGSKATT